QFSVQKNPAPAVEAVSPMVDLNCRCGQLVSLFCTPRQGVQPSIDRSGRSSPVVKVRPAEANHWAEGPLPSKRGQTWHDLGIRLEFQTLGTGRLLILVDHERSGKSHIVISKLPSAGLAISRSGEGPPTQHQHVSTATEKLVNVRPNLLWERRAVREYQQTSRRGCQHARQLLR